MNRLQCCFFPFTPSPRSALAKSNRLWSSQYLRKRFPNKCKVLKGWILWSRGWNPDSGPMSMSNWYFALIREDVQLPQPKAAELLNTSLKTRPMALLTSALAKSAFFLLLLLQYQLARTPSLFPDQPILNSLFHSKDAALYSEEKDAFLTGRRTAQPLRIKANT